MITTMMTMESVKTTSQCYGTCRRPDPWAKTSTFGSARAVFCNERQMLNGEYWMWFAFKADTISAGQSQQQKLKQSLGTNVIHGENAPFHDGFLKICQISWKIH